MSTASQLSPATAARRLMPAVNTVLLAQALAECERERCDTIQRAVLAEQNYYENGTRAKSSDGHTARITDPRKAWLMPTDDHDRYWSIVHARYIRAGFHVAEYGQCPALVAESLLIDARHALIAAAEELFPGVTVDRLFCQPNGMDKYREYIDLLVKLVVNSPSWVPPVIPKAG